MGVTCMHPVYWCLLCMLIGKRKVLRHSEGLDKILDPLLLLFGFKFYFHTTEQIFEIE